MEIILSSRKVEIVEGYMPSILSLEALAIVYDRMPNALLNIHELMNFNR